MLGTGLYNAMTLQKGFVRAALRPSVSSVISGAPGASRGFTLVELIVAVSIMSVLAAVALPRINLHQFRIDAGVRRVQAALQQGARFAVQRQHDMVVGFDVPGNKVMVLDDRNNNGAIDGGERVMWHALEDGVRFVAPPAAIGSGNVGAVAGAKLETLNGYPSVRFRRDGAASTDVQVYITSTRDVATDFKALSVTKSTGRVDYYSYRTGTWKKGGA